MFRKSGGENLDEELFKIGELPSGGLCTRKPLSLQRAQLSPLRVPWPCFVKLLSQPYARLRNPFHSHE
jgi:hypothetical protein